MIPTPTQIFADFERGAMDREELHSLMALHARELIQEMENDYQNPAAAWIEGVLAKRAAGRLVRRHGSQLLREVLVALAEIPNFPPATHLWNAAHPDVPLHCFLRIRREPVFRIVSVDVQPQRIQVVIEHGQPARGKPTRREFIMRRSESWKLKAELV